MDHVIVLLVAGQCLCSSMEPRSTHDPMTCVVWIHIGNPLGKSLSNMRICPRSIIAM